MSTDPFEPVSTPSTAFPRSHPPAPNLWAGEIVKVRSVGKGRGRKGELSIVTREREGKAGIEERTEWQVPAETIRSGRLRGLSTASFASTTSSTAYSPSTSTTNTNINTNTNTTPSTPFSQSQTLVSVPSSASQFSSSSSSHSPSSTNAHGYVYAAYPGLSHLRETSTSSSFGELGGQPVFLISGSKGNKGLEFRDHGGVGSDLQARSPAVSISHPNPNTHGNLANDSGRNNPPPPLARAITENGPTPDRDDPHVRLPDQGHSGNGNGRGWTGLLSKLKSKSSINLKARAAADRAKGINPTKALPRHAEGSIAVPSGRRHDDAEPVSTAQPWNKPTLKREDTKRSIVTTTTTSTHSKSSRRRKARASEDSFECAGDTGDADANEAKRGAVDEEDVEYRRRMGRLDLFGVDGIDSAAFPIESDSASLRSAGVGNIPDVPAIPARYQQLQQGDRQNGCQPQSVSPLMSASHAFSNSYPSSTPPGQSHMFKPVGGDGQKSRTTASASSPLLATAPPLARLDTTGTGAENFRARDGGWATVQSKFTSRRALDEVSSKDWSPNADYLSSSLSLSLSAGERDRYPGSASSLASPNLTHSRAFAPNTFTRSNGTCSEASMTPSNEFDFAIGLDPFGVEGKPFDEDEFHRHVGNGSTASPGGLTSALQSPMEACDELLPPRAAFSTGGNRREGLGSRKGSMESMGSRKPRLDQGSIRSSPSMTSLRKFGQGLRESFASSASSANLAKVARGPESATPKPLVAPSLKQSRTSPNLKALGKSQLGMVSRVDTINPEVGQIVLQDRAVGATGMRKTTSMFFRQRATPKDGSKAEGTAKLDLPSPVVVIPATPRITPPSPNPLAVAHGRDEASARDAKSARPRLKLSLSSLRSRSDRLRSATSDVGSPSSGTTEAMPVKSSLSRLLPPANHNQSLSMPSLPSDSSFSDLYRELGVSPPASDDDDDMPYSPSMPDTRFPARSVHRQSGHSIASLAPIIPLPVAPRPQLRATASTPQLRLPGKVMPLDTQKPAGRGSFAEVPGSHEPGDVSQLFEEYGWNLSACTDAGEGGIDNTKSQGTQSDGLNATPDAQQRVRGSTTMSSFQSHRGRTKGGSESDSRSRSPSIPRRRGGPLVEESLRPRATIEHNSDSDAVEGDSPDESDESDDVPLAQRSSSALQAQKSLRAEGKKARKDKLISDYLSRGPAEGYSGTDRLRTTAPLPAAGGTQTPAWDGEGGVPPKVLERKLAELCRLQDASASTMAPPGLARTTAPVTTLRPRPSRHVVLPRQTEQLRPAQPPLRRAESDSRPPATFFSSKPTGKSSLTNTSKGPDFQPAQMKPSLGVHHNASVPRSRQTSANMSQTPGGSDASASRAKRMPLHSSGNSAGMAISAPQDDGRAQHVATVAITVYATAADSHSVSLAITPSTTATDLIQSSVGMDRDTVSDGRKGWAQWTVMLMRNDTPQMERPVRSWECVLNALGDQTQDTRIVVRRSSLHPLTSQRLVPGVHPARGGYVQYETKPGKWIKKWMEIRDGSVFLAKNDKGKENVFLCSSSSYDAFRVTQASNAPKAFAFALKSDEPATMFEDVSDYMHTFCCDESTGATLYPALHSAKSVAMLRDRPSDTESTSEFRRPTAEPLVSFHDGKSFEGGSLLSRLRK